MIIRYNRWILKKLQNIGFILGMVINVLLFIQAFISIRATIILIVSSQRPVILQHL